MSAGPSQSLPPLARLVRGLSALFWGLPLALLVSVKTATSDWFRPWGPLPPILVHGLLYFALWQLTAFRRHERSWVLALDQAKILGLINVGLSPFLYFWNVRPENNYFTYAVGMLALSSVVFLFNLNRLLERLAALLPDELLRSEVRWLTALNAYLLIALVLVMSVYAALANTVRLPVKLLQFRDLLEFSRSWLLLALTLVPVSLTMALVWKIKETVLIGLFRDRKPESEAPDSGRE